MWGETSVCWREWWFLFFLSLWVVLGSVLTEGDKKWKERWVFYIGQGKEQNQKGPSCPLQTTWTEEIKSISTSQPKRAFPWGRGRRSLLSPCAFVLSSSRKTSISRTLHLEPTPTSLRTGQYPPSSTWLATSSMTKLALPLGFSKLLTPLLNLGG